MNREIIFRGKCIDNGEWVKGALYDGYSQDKALIILNLDVRDIAEGSETNEAHEVDRATVGQFTGLYDMNGKEIFEGDTVRYRNTQMIVEWAGNYASWRLKRENGLYSYFGTSSVDYKLCEVVGNIYDQ